MAVTLSQTKAKLIVKVHEAFATIKCTSIRQSMHWNRVIGVACCAPPIAVLAATVASSFSCCFFHRKQMPPKLLKVSTAAPPRSASLLQIVCCDAITRGLSRALAAAARFSLALGGFAHESITWIHFIVGIVGALLVGAANAKLAEVHCVFLFKHPLLVK